LAALVQVTNHVDRLPLLKRRQDDLGAQVIGHRPADHPPAPCIDHDGEIRKPRTLVGVTLGLSHPLANALCGRLKLSGEFLGKAA
jgi:hypothetical protein